MFDKYDVVIIGGGVAGLYAAYNFPDNVNVLLVSKRKLVLCNSALAQGGIAAVLDEINDDSDLHYNDTMIAGGNENNPDAVRVLVNEGPFDVKTMMSIGAEFDTKNGVVDMTLEGGHSRNRVVHHKDSTGAEIMRALIVAVKMKDNVHILEETTLAFLDEASAGYFVTFLNASGFFTVAAGYVMLATGGIGRVYKHTTNSSIATGDGITAAFKIGARISNLHYIQFHPTAFAAKSGRERFLISEAVRGEGAYLLNNDRQRFMHKYDNRLELAPRDVVSRSIMLESRRMGSEKFYLDITHKNKQFVKDRFPMIYERCRMEGVDITHDLIPIFPCQHYLMGGIDVDLFGKTRISHLYAIGECSHTGVHGKNRLASNSLLEALVFSRRAVEHILQQNNSAEVVGTPPNHITEGAPMPHGMRTAIRGIMQKSYFVLPNVDSAHKYIDEIVDIKNRLARNAFNITRDFIEAQSLAEIAEKILKEALGL